MPRSRQPRTNPEALDALRERLRATQQAAQKLAEEAAAAAPRVPPSGWDVPGRADDANAELEALVAMLSTVKEMIPPELRAQLAELVRQILVFVRAVLDWWIAQVEGGEPGEERQVEDIPIA
jgi:hypothetical protein